MAAIELAGGLEVVGQAGYLLAAVSLIAETSPDVVILDPRLPDVDGGTALVTSVRKLGLSTRILLMSWSVEHENADLVKAVDAFIDKCAPPEAFVQAMRCFLHLALKDVEAFAHLPEFVVRQNLDRNDIHRHVRSIEISAT